MCLGVYVASDLELETVPFYEWKPAFNVTELQPFEESVRGILKRRFAYAVGSHTSCGCGFQPNDESEPEDFAASRDALSSYLASGQVSGPLDVYVCWNGDADDQPAQVLELTPHEMRTLDHWLIEGTLVRVVPGAA